MVFLLLLSQCERHVSRQDKHPMFIVEHTRRFDPPHTHQEIEEPMPPPSHSAVPEQRPPVVDMSWQNNSVSVAADITIRPRRDLHPANMMSSTNPALLENVARLDWLPMTAY